MKIHFLSFSEKHSGANCRNEIYPTRHFAILYKYVQLAKKNHFVCLYLLFDIIYYALAIFI